MSIIVSASQVNGDAFRLAILALENSGVISVRVTECARENSLPKELKETVLDFPLVARIPKTGSHLLSQAKLAANGAKKQATAIRAL